MLSLCSGSLVNHQRASPSLSHHGYGALTRALVIACTPFPLSPSSEKDDGLYAWHGLGHMHASARACIFRFAVASQALVVVDSTIGSIHPIHDGSSSKPAQEMRLQARPTALPHNCHFLQGQESSVHKLFLHSSYFRSVGRVANDRTTMTGLVSRRTRPSCPTFARTGTLTPGWYYSTAMTGQAGANLQCVGDEGR